MKLAYVTNIDLDAPNHKGVKNKIFGQAAAFNQSNIQTTIICRSANRIISFQDEHEYEVIHEFSKNRWISIVQRRNFFQKITDLINELKPNIIYLRYPLSSKDLYSFLKKIDTKIIIEIPTYPYKKEFKNGIKHKISILIDKFWRKKVSSMVNRYVTIGEDLSTLDDVQVIQISNGFYWNHSIPKLKNNITRPFQVVFMGNPMAHHGIEFLNIFHNCDVEINFVGNSIYLENLKLKLDKLSVKYYNYMDDQKLSDFLSEMDFGISTLSDKIKDHSALKSRFYALHGIPFIFTGVDIDFKKNTFSYNIKDINNIDQIKMKEILNHLSKVNRVMLQNYALTQLSWTKKMQPIIEYVKE